MGDYNRLRLPHYLEINDMPDKNSMVEMEDGKVSQLEHVFIRGSKVRFMVIPDMLKNAPMFKRLEARIKGKGSSLGVGRGRGVAMRARPVVELHHR